MARSRLNTGACVRILEACMRSKSLIEGKKIHQCILKSNARIDNVVVFEKLALFYVRCGEVKVARVVFDQVSSRNVILWNSIIRAYAWNGQYEKAIDLYYEMCDSGIRPNKFTFPFVLKACSGLKALEDGVEIRERAKVEGLDSDVYVSTALLDFYVKCGCLSEAQALFGKMMYKDVVSWNAMIAGSALHGLYEETMRLVFEMQETGNVPNSSTLVAILPAIGRTKALCQGKSVHGFRLRRAFDKETLIETALLDMYAKCESLNYAKRVFDFVGVKNEVTWSAMIGAYVLAGCMKEALALFDKMQIEGVVTLTPATLGSVLRACAKLTDIGRGRCIHGNLIKSGICLDLTIGNSLLSMYSKSGNLDDATNLFDEMNLKDVVSYSAIISGCVQNGNAEEALLMFHNMQLSGIDPDIATMVGILPACAHLAALQHGRCSHGQLTVRGFSSDISIGNALIDMYSKCGRVDFAKDVFYRMPKQDIISWNAMVAGYGMHGHGMEALTLFHDMLRKGLKPDSVSFICLLSACSHSGLVAEGKHWFCAMTRDFNIVPRMEHCICMVDLLGRGGFLGEATDFIEKMPFEPDVRIWGALLGACRIHRNIKLGEEVSKKIQNLGAEGTGNFVLLSNIYSAAGRWKDAAHIRLIQRNKGFKKSPGCSWIEVSGRIHAFIGGDRSHPQSAQIHEKLDELLVEMKKLGYHADGSFALQDVEEEEKERILLYHSEKLAIAFGILNLRPSDPIFVTKNLRVCGDCHSAIKLLSMITNRTIIVRDTSRYHHFALGACNCGDFW
ncbi:hypothetical protein Scep_016097 [Stephania cephalantha]|uniref:DYW domain-containing protein n=1 Tax=Stephania cephalantha TaxID=152367 RepID=A0AAP0ILY0_9MAGN